MTIVLDPERHARLCAGLERGLADSAAGRDTPAAEVYARLQEKYGVRW